MIVKLKQIHISHTNKQGQPLLDSNQRPYNRVAIKTDQHGDRWLSGFAYANSPMLAWRIGDEVDIEVEEKGRYLNFRLPRRGNSENIGFIVAELKALRAIVEETHRAVMDLVVEPTPPDGGPKAEDIQEEELPF